MLADGHSRKEGEVLRHITNISVGRLPPSHVDAVDNDPAATELAKDWRTDRALRRLEALLIAVDAKHTLLVTGNGDVIQPTDGVLATGSGGGYALAAARALIAHSNLSASEIVRESLVVAGGIDIYTNTHLTVEELPCLSTS